MNLNYENRSIIKIKIKSIAQTNFQNTTNGTDTKSSITARLGRWSEMIPEHPHPHGRSGRRGNRKMNK